MIVLLVVALCVVGLTALMDLSVFFGKKPADWTRAEAAMAEAAVIIHVPALLVSIVALALVLAR